MSLSQVRVSQEKRNADGLLRAVIRVIESLQNRMRSVRSLKVRFFAFASGRFLRNGQADLLSSRVDRAREEVGTFRHVIHSHLARRFSWFHLLPRFTGTSGLLLALLSTSFRETDAISQLAHETVPSSLHGSPSDAVDIHLDVKSRNSIGSSTPPFHFAPPSDRSLLLLAGIHFGTFIGAEEETLEAVVELHETCEEKSVGPLTDEGVEKENGRMGVINLGETFVVEIADLVIV